MQELQHLDILDRAISVARSQMGLKEIPIGSNWGKNVQKYLASVGIKFPASWCMAFVYWCFNEAYKEIAQTNILVKTGGVLDQWHKIDEKYHFKTPKRGSIFILDFGKGLGHTGIVEKVSPDGSQIFTIEGNTNDDGSREGYEVSRRIRKTSSCVGFINVA